MNMQKLPQCLDVLQSIELHFILRNLSLQKYAIEVPLLKVNPLFLFSQNLLYHL